jgi:hypothetical protein
VELVALGRVDGALAEQLAGAQAPAAANACGIDRPLPMIGSMSSQSAVMTRWRRYGKDRLYVQTADGAKLGWWDLATDESHPESPEDRAALVAAVAAWRAAEVTAPAHSPDVPPQVAGPDTPFEEPVRPWQDLAANQAGAEAREQAQAARDAAPVRTVLARVLGVHTDERAWRIGADGEEKVAAQLAKAAKKDPRWRFVHSIPVGERGSDIDHLVVGPGGVFTVNAKHHPRAKIWVGGNTFMVNGSRQPYIRNSRHEAARAAKLLTAACGFPVHVEGLVVTVNAADVVIKQQPDGVHVTWRNNLAKWLIRHGDIYTSGTIDAIFDAARRSTTWRR